MLIIAQMETHIGDKTTLTEDFSSDCLTFTPSHFSMFSTFRGSQLKRITEACLALLTTLKLTLPGTKLRTAFLWWRVCVKLSDDDREASSVINQAMDCRKDAKERVSCLE